MKKRALLGLPVLVMMISLSGVTAHAQGFDTFIGYSFDTSPSLHGYNVAVTWNLTHKVGIEANFAGHHGSLVPLASTTAPTGMQDQDEDTVTYTFGPKLTHVVGPNKNFEIYTHFLVGGAHVHSSLANSGPFFCGTTGTCFVSSQKGSGFGFVTGGGLDWFHGVWGVRILEADFVLINADVTSKSTGSSTTTFVAHQKNFRLATGLIFRWGGK